MENIIDTIKVQLEANKHGLDWARAYLRTSQLSETRKALIQNRINLKRIERAMSVNPAAAVFGESQVGKSYMVDCLLTSDTEVLNIYDGNGNATGFIEYINPIGGGKESTSLISRFTQQKVWKNKDYPVRVEMLPPIEVVMVIVDTYFNDVNNLRLPKVDEIKAEIERLQKAYNGKSCCQEVITEDEIFELREYFTLSMLQRGEAFREALIDCGYFETLANLISNINVTDWENVFGFLWNHQEKLSQVFTLLMQCLQSMSFSKTVYIKMDAVLRSPGTILHVDRIYELFGLSTCTDEKGEVRTIVPAEVPEMEVFTETGAQINGVKKSEFCAVAMEVAFTITPSDSEDLGIVKQKPFLKYLDILDFPGARSRKMFNADLISESEACEMMLRGKVAYLFNKYSQQYLISNLLFCHHAEQSNVSTLSSLMKGWVENTVGQTPAERSIFMQNTDVPPLFIIGTKFNMDLKKTPDDSKGTDKDKEQARNYRWTKRFGNLMNLIAPSATNNWMTDWTPNNPFTNVYLLRSYEYSCQDRLYEGYQEKDPVTENWKLIYKKDGTLQGETNISSEYLPFFDALKDSFEENDFVKKHFKDSKQSWREVIGYPEANNAEKWHPCDGSAWIIENLTKSSEKMATIRDLQVNRVLRSSFERLVKVLYDFYHDDNSDAELRKQLNLAGSINLTFDALFGKDKYFFSDFISALTIEEEYLHDVVLDTINATAMIDETDLSVLFAIRANAKIDPQLSYEENKRRLRETYACQTDEELDKILSSLKITIEDIINPPKVVNFSHLVASAIADSWCRVYLNVERYKEFIHRGLNQTLLENLFANMKVLYRDKVKMSDLIAKRIHPYVSASSGSLDEMSDMLADICAEMINTFINSMGSAFYDGETWQDIESAVQHNDFDLTINTTEYQEIQFSEEAIKLELPEVFNVFDNVDKILNEVPVDLNKLEHFSNYEEYRKWIQRMKISFLATQGIPKYNVDMNNALRSVLVNQIVSQVLLEELVQSNELLKSLSTI